MKNLVNIRQVTAHLQHSSMDFRGCIQWECQQILSAFCIYSDSLKQNKALMCNCDVPILKTINRTEDSGGFSLFHSTKDIWKIKHLEKIDEEWSWLWAQRVKLSEAGESCHALHDSKTIKMSFKDIASKPAKNPKQIDWEMSLFCIHLQVLLYHWSNNIWENTDFIMRLCH